MEDFTFETKETNKVAKVVYGIAPIFIWVSIVIIMLVLFAFIVFNYHDKPYEEYKTFYNVKISEGNVCLEEKDNFIVIPNDAKVVCFIESNIDKMWCKVFYKDNQIDRYELHIPTDIANENIDVIFKNHPLH